MTTRLETLVALRAEADRLIQDEIRLRDSTRSLIERLHLADSVDAASWPEEILRAVSAHFEVAIPLIIGPSRAKEHVRPRLVAAWLMRRYGLSFCHVGRHLGNRDHTTIMSAVKTVEARPELLDIAMSIREQTRAIGGAA